MTMLILFLLGLCAGSFVNALVWRLHEQSLILESKTAKSKKSQTRLRQLSILKGRSVCPSCDHQLRAIDLIPLISWLGLRGKCRYCHKSISVQYPLVELSTAILFALIYHLSPLRLQGLSVQTLVFVGWLALTVVLIALFVYDLKWMLFPDVLLKVLLGVSVVVAALTVLSGNGLYTDAWSPLIGLVIVGGFLGSLYAVSGGKWMGWGDVPLGAAVGLALGWKLGLLALVGSFYVGTIIVLPTLLSKKSKLTSRVPFGPFLIISTYISLFWGQQIIDWYMRVIVHV